MNFSSKSRSEKLSLDYPGRSIVITRVFVSGRLGKKKKKSVRMETEVGVVHFEDGGKGPQA